MDYLQFLLGTHLADNVAIILTLVVLEGLLSADNALVLAILVRHLPPLQQKKALRYGIAGAFIFRAIGVVTATFLLHYWQFKAAGAFYLLYLPAKHYIQKIKNKNNPENKKLIGPGFWKTILLVELTDVAFSIDSIVAAVAMSKQLWVVYTGGILGIITMRFVAGGFLKLLDRFPKLEDAAYLLVGWIGLKLGLETINQILTGHHDVGPYIMPKWLFWAAMGIIFFGSLILSLKKKPAVRENTTDTSCS
jgi:YkoY family integral membrane protein